MNDYIIKRTGIDTAEQQVRVYMDSFGHGEDEFESLKKKWMIKHFDNPNGESYIFGAFDGEHLVGMNCFLQMHYTLNGNNLEIVQSCESGVLNSHQRRGIWGKIMSFAREYLTENTKVDMIIGFPNYRNSYPGFVKLGWDTLFNEKNYLMINNGILAVNMYAGKKWWEILGVLLNIQRFKVLKLSNKKYSITEVDSFDKTESDGIRLYIDEEWIAWKKKYGSILIHEVKRDNQLVMRIISQEDCLNNTKYLKILDIIPVVKFDNIIDEALSSYLRLIKQSDYSVIRAWSKGDSIYKRLGFIEMKKHINPFIVLLLRNEKEFLKNPDLWNPTFLDLD